jgi:hypothetical protein
LKQLGLLSRQADIRQVTGASSVTISPPEAARAREARKSETAGITSCLVIPSAPACCFENSSRFSRVLERLFDLDRPDDLARWSGLLE